MSQDEAGDRGLVPLIINNKSYATIKHVPLYISSELKTELEGRKAKDGTPLYTIVCEYGFKGGKHLLQLVDTKYPGSAIVLSHEPSSISSKIITINYNRYRRITTPRFYALYRQTGLDGAQHFLSSEFPDNFRSTVVPSAKVVKTVLSDLPEIAKNLPLRTRRRLPKQILESIAANDPNFLLTILRCVETTSEQTRQAVQELLTKAGRGIEAEQAVQQLAGFMQDWNLGQVTSLLSILRTRLHTIDTFDKMIHNDATYEIMGPNSIHRILERSMWLIDDKYWIVQSNHSLREFIGAELEKQDKEYERRRPDFACAMHGTETLVLIEIKRPSLELNRKELDQIEDYRLIARKYTGKKRYSNVKAYLVGKRISDDLRERAKGRGIVLWTYDDLLYSCRNRYQEYLKIVERGRKRVFLKRFYQQQTRHFVPILI